MSKATVRKDHRIMRALCRAGACDEGAREFDLSPAGAYRKLRRVVLVDGRTSRLLLAVRYLTGDFSYGPSHDTFGLTDEQIAEGFKRIREWAHKRGYSLR